VDRQSVAHARHLSWELQRRLVRTTLPEQQLPAYEERVLERRAMGRHIGWAGRSVVAHDQWSGSPPCSCLPLWWRWPAVRQVRQTGPRRAHPYRQQRGCQRFRRMHQQGLEVRTSTVIRAAVR
jgi:hypothetical protein